MKLVKFRAEHLQRLTLQPAQRYFHGNFEDPAYGRALETSAFSFTGLDDDGAVIGCAGVHELWQGRAVAWALLSADAGPHFKAIHKAARGFFVQAPWRRIEAMVEDGFDAGHRWAKMLGMDHEGCMRAYSPGGKDFHIYARITPWTR